MKILHTADIHLGIKINKLPKDKSSLMKDEILYNLRQFFRLAEEYDVILICGDLFHNNQVTEKIKRTFFDCVIKFAKPVIYIEGNHDEKTLLENVPENFVILNNSNNKFYYEGINFFTNVDNGFVLKEETNILLLHGNIENSSDRDYIDIEKYINCGFDYIALGHIHQYKVIKKNNTTLAYPGSLFSNGFDESGNKGYIKLEIENKKIEKIEFCQFPARRFMINQCDISGKNNNREIYDCIIESFNSNRITKKDLIRVILRGITKEDCDKSLSLLQDRLSDYFYVEIEDQTKIEIDFEKIKNEKLSFKYEFLRLLEESELDEKQKNIIAQIGIEALKGEELSI